MALGQPSVCYTKKQGTDFFGLILLPCLGFALLRLWIMCLEEQGMVFSDNHLDFIFYLLARGGVPLVIVIILGAKPLTSKMLKSTLSIAALVMATCGPLVLIDLPDSFSSLKLVGTLLGSAALGWLYSCWAEVYRAIRIREVSLSLLLSLLLSSVLLLVLSLLPLSASIVCVVSIPLLALRIFFYYREKDLPPVDKRGSFAGYYDRQMIALFGKWFMMLALYSMVIGAIHAISSNATSDYSHVFLYSIYSVTAIGLASVLAIGLLSSDRIFSLDAFWVIIVPTICISLVLALVFGDMLQISLSIFAGIRYVVFGFINIKLVDIAHHSRMPLYAIFAAGWGILSISMALGMAFALYFLENLNFSISVVATILLAALAIGSLLLVNNSSLSDIFIGKDKDRRSERPGGNDVEAALLRSCQGLRTRFGLTERETQIVLLLAQGHTQIFCADTLMVSINTIRGHMKHLYTKLDIHSKEELLQLLSKE